MKILPHIERCSKCAFNEHGQETERNSDKKILKKVHFGMPLLYCCYDPKQSLKTNIRNLHRRLGNYKKDNHCRIIWIAGDEDLEPEFSKQLIGFPDWCPLEDLKV